MKYYVLIFLTITIIVNAQEEFSRWEAKAPSYVEVPVSSAESNFGFLGYVQKGYKFLISDLDGDNCPFYPSCSTFFVKAGKEAGFFRAALMFADRFTRDTNLFKSKTAYPVNKSGKFYDPVENHLHYEKYIHF